ncbi:MAG: hypothetical protein FJW21_09260 [Acidimicrobiia bacterium]|nr:hypothetical protein [Acidimicrobiia bacterium]
MVIHSGGVVLVVGTFLLPHHRARKRRDQLQLDAMQLTDLRYAVRGHLIGAGLGVVSLILVGLMPHQSGWSDDKGGRAKHALSTAHPAPSTSAEHPAPSTQHDSNA